MLEVFLIQIAVQKFVTATHIEFHRYSTQRILQFCMYINQQDAQNSCDSTLFSIRCSTCFGLYQSIIRSNFISCTSHLVYAGICRYVWLLCGYSHTKTRQPHNVSAYTGIYQMRCTAYKVAPDDGLVQSKTCRASNGK